MPAYWVYVGAESEDQVALIRLEGGALVVEKTIEVGSRPAEIEGPHGLTVSPDGEYWYVSLAHGNPFGSVVKYRTGTDARVGSVEVGMFPATMDIAASTGFLYAANFDLHGGMAPSSISVVETTDLIEIARVEVGMMPHSSRLNAGEDRHYSVMMMTGELVEVDAFGFEVVRRLSLSGGATARPTWVEPAPSGRFVYVASNGTNEIQEIDLESWMAARTFETPEGPYNIGITEDGALMVVTYRGAGTTGIWDVLEGREIARIRNSKRLPHGVALTPDSRYALISVEGVAGEAGGVDAIDLEALRRVSSVEIGRQASGIAFWKSEMR